MKSGRRVKRNEALTQAWGLVQVGVGDQVWGQVNSQVRLHRVLAEVDRLVGQAGIVIQLGRLPSRPRP